MPLEQTSLEAYKDVKTRLVRRQKEVFKAIVDIRHAACDVEIARQLGWTINCVTPRRGELEQKGFIKKVGTTRSPCGRRMNVYLPADYEMPSALALMVV